MWSNYILKSCVEEIIIVINELMCGTKVKWVMLLPDNARVPGSSLDLDECMKFILVLFQGFKSMYETDLS